MKISEVFRNANWKLIEFKLFFSHLTIWSPNFHYSLRLWEQLISDDSCMFNVFSIKVCMLRYENQNVTSCLSFRFTQVFRGQSSYSISVKKMLSWVNGKDGEWYLRTFCYLPWEIILHEIRFLSNHLFTVDIHFSCTTQLSFWTYLQTFLSSYKIDISSWWLLSLVWDF